MKSQTPYPLLLLETGTLPIEILGMERVVEYVVKLQQHPTHRLPKVAWEASCKLQKTHKSKILSTGWMQDISKWFKKWNAHHLLHDASLDPTINEAFLQRQCITKWEAHGGSRFIHYTTHIAPGYKAIFFSERSSRTHPYLLETIPISAIRTLAAIRLSSHPLRSETGRWGTGVESLRLCTLCPMGVRETEHHTLLDCSAFDHLRARFPQLFNEPHTISSFISQHARGLSIATLITTVLAHRETLITSQQTM